MKRALAIGVLGLGAAVSGCAGGGSSPVIVNSQANTTANTPTVVMANSGMMYSNNPLGIAAITAQQGLNSAATGVQQALAPWTSKPTNVYTTSPNLVMVQSQATWQPFPAVGPLGGSMPGVYVVGGNNAVAQPVGQNLLTPAAINAITQGKR